MAMFIAPVKVDRIASHREYSVTNGGSRWKMDVTNRSMKEDPWSKGTEIRWTTTNQTRTHRSPTWTCRNRIPYISTNCFVAAFRTGLRTVLSQYYKECAMARLLKSFGPAWVSSMATICVIKFAFSPMVTQS